MIAVDTNVIVRFLTGDDPIQSPQATQILTTQDTIFIPDTVILETEWVLRYAYQFEPEAIKEAFQKLFGLANIELRDVTTIQTTLEWYEKGLDFADALHLAQAQHCQHMLTFDQKFVARSQSIVPDWVQSP